MLMGGNCVLADVLVVVCCDGDDVVWRSEAVADAIVYVGARECCRRRRRSRWRRRGKMSGVDVELLKWAGGVLISYRSVSTEY